VAGTLGGGGWELRCEHNIAIIFSCRAFFIDSAAGRAEGGGVGYPGESIIRRTSALTRLECKVFGKNGTDEDEFVSDMRIGLPLLPSSSDEHVSILLKALIVDFVSIVGPCSRKRNASIDNCGTIGKSRIAE
jgi:hypothetical protein